MVCKLCGPKLSLCGLVLSVWGVIQLTLMGVFYHIRAVALLEDLPLDEEGGHHDIDHFIGQVEYGYTVNAQNCWIAALLYLVTLVVSGHQFWMNNRSSVIMGIFFKLEVVAFIEEAEPEHHSYEDFEDFMKQTEKNYSLIAMNCWIGAVIYLLMIGLSYLCIAKARANEKAAAEQGKDDEEFCKGLMKSKNS
ncbi:unnamed protein product [Leptosia nina]|uniref:Uncharacterized protein n=1 Tax=Leptosia nina TaxID=320188 RepID=A0AAV1JRT3_9NEOP